ncbi:MAG: hypothetical protein U0931_23210 [Vulcanimicrobiota bacterium]
MGYYAWAMIVNPNLRRQFSTIDFSRVPARPLDSSERERVLSQVESDWNKFEAYDQNKADRDPRQGRLDVYNHPARYQAEVSKNTLYVCESMLPGGDPNGIPLSCVQRESSQNDNRVIRYESTQDEAGLRLRRYQIDNQDAQVQEWLICARRG